MDNFQLACATLAFELVGHDDHHRALGIIHQFFRG